MRLVLVHNSYLQPGGEDVVVQQEADLLQAAGHHVTLYRRSNEELFNHNRMRAAVTSLWSASTKRAFALLLSRIRPDIVHVHNTFMTISPSIYSACTEQNIPIVQTLHNYRWICPNALLERDGQNCDACLRHGVANGVMNRCYHSSLLDTGLIAMIISLHQSRSLWRRVDRFIALSQFAREIFVRAGFPESRIDVKPNCVQPDPGVASGSRDYAMYLGRLSHEKGVLPLVQAWRDFTPHVPLVVVGDGPAFDALQTHASSCPAVTLSGRLLRSEALHLLQRARFLVAPSLCYESFPMTVVEAFACGVPVIGFRTGAIGEIVEHRRTGLLVTAGDFRQFTEAVSWAWSHPRELSEMGTRCREVYLARYSSDRNCEALVNIYMRTIEEHRRPAVVRLYENTLTSRP